MAMPVRHCVPTTVSYRLEMDVAATPLRNIRIEDELWDACGEKAHLEGRGRSEVIRDLLTAWVAKPPAPPAKPKLRTWKD